MTLSLGKKKHMLLLSLSLSLPLFFFLLPAKQSGATVICNRIYYYKLLLLGYKLCVGRVAGHKMCQPAPDYLTTHTHTHTYTNRLTPASAQIRELPSSHAALGFILSLFPPRFRKTQPPLNVNPDLCSGQRAPAPHRLPKNRQTNKRRPN